MPIYLGLDFYSLAIHENICNKLIRFKIENNINIENNEQICEKLNENKKLVVNLDQKQRLKSIHTKKVSFDESVIFYGSPDNHVFESDSGLSDSMVISTNRENNSVNEIKSKTNSEVITTKTSDNLDKRVNNLANHSFFRRKGVKANFPKTSKYFSEDYKPKIDQIFTQFMAIPKRPKLSAIIETPIKKLKTEITSTEMIPISQSITDKTNNYWFSLQNSLQNNKQIESNNNSHISDVKPVLKKTSIVTESQNSATNGKTGFSMDYNSRIGDKQSLCTSRVNPLRNLFFTSNNESINNSVDINRELTKTQNNLSDRHVFPIYSQRDKKRQLFQNPFVPKIMAKRMQNTVIFEE